MRPFIGKWITLPPFDTVTPINMYHRESEDVDLAKDHPESLRNLHALFSRRFNIESKGQKYLLRISADDYGKFYVNGAFVGQGPAPSFLENFNYCEIDITDFLKEGENEIAVHCYYQGLINRVWISGDLRCGIIADLICDGRVVLSTDEKWEYRKINNYVSGGTVGYITQYLENYDGNLPLGEKNPVVIRGDMGITFACKPRPQLDFYDVKPISTEKIGNGIFCDFGKEYVGSVKIKAFGKKGDRVRILCGEERNDSPEKTRFDMRCNCRYEEFWTLHDGENELNQYDYKAFRYASIIPENESTKLESIVLAARNYPFDDNACVIETDNNVLKSVFELCKQGVKIGTQEAFMDCPSREKGQYTGDATVTTDTHVWLSGSTDMLEKIIVDEKFSTVIDDGIMATVCGSYMQEIADYSLQFPIHLLRHYNFTGDKAFLEKMLPTAETMCRHFEVYCREDGLLDGVSDKWNLVDWPDNLRDGYDFPLTRPIGKGTHNIVNAFYVGCVLQIEEIKDILGIPHDDKGQKLVKAFNSAFFKPELGLYTDTEASNHTSLPSNIIPCYYGFQPKEYNKKLGDFMISRGLVCGVYMAYFLLKALCKMERYEDVYDLIVSEDENSWYNMVREGGTTCFEAWGVDKKWNTSLCHPWASAPIPVLFEDLMGISPNGEFKTPKIPKKAGKIRVTTALHGGITVIANDDN